MAAARHPGKHPRIQLGAICAVAVSQIALGAIHSSDLLAETFYDQRISIRPTWGNFAVQLTVTLNALCSAFLFACSGKSSFGRNALARLPSGREIVVVGHIAILVEWNFSEFFRLALAVASVISMTASVRNIIGRELSRGLLFLIWSSAVFSAQWWATYSATDDGLVDQTIEMKGLSGIVYGSLALYMCTLPLRSLRHSSRF